ncbi:alpha/beta hydrolase family protein [Myroides pelagicus]|uniref:Prolyl oligopeptidase family serine peptidase n=1 Tax=Myroides pelagicus TaxID=270914 RepID=A0A7K1GNK8_9FLAO|nr:prolyl oligopeptidase family serine peptidase [Myroides pelagicus]MEC4113068.1 prolyl oligopeptidase family serine peptidase [Myroides pelagicus]MTH29973.1 prolyl oligopeptidase family serine peptidase [Myroides pelagicus]
MKQTKPTYSSRENTSFFKNLGFALLAMSTLSLHAQKKPLDHSVYDSWESIGEKAITNDGQWIMYQVKPQEGDKTVYFKTIDGKQELKVDRGEKPVFTGSSNFAVVSIRPTYADLKAVKIKKKKEDEIAKDSLGIFNLKTGDVHKIANVKSFKTPEDKGDFLAYLLEKEKDTAKAKDKKASKKKADKDTPLKLVLKDLLADSTVTYDDVVDYFFDKNGQYLVVITKDPSAKKKDDDDKKEEEIADSDAKDNTKAESRADQDIVEATGPFGVFAIDLKSKKKYTLLEGKGKYTKFSFDETGNQLAFIANEDEEKTLVKTYTVYHTQLPKPAKPMISDQSKGIPSDWVVSENYEPAFSKNGKRMFIGIAPRPIARDTTLVVEDHAILDIWHYKEDYLQPQQLANLDKDLKKSYLAVVDFTKGSTVVPLADDQMDRVSLVDQGDASIVFGSSDFGYRVEKQWDISGHTSYYIVDIQTGKRTEVISGLKGTARISPKGKAVVYYNSEEKNWYAYDVKSKTKKLLNKGLSVSFADELFDMPDDAYAYGIEGWTANDESVLIRDRYDIWEFFLSSNKAPRMITKGYGRENHVRFELLNLDKEKKAYDRSDVLVLAAFNEKTKDAGYYRISVKSSKEPQVVFMQAYDGFKSLFKAKESEVYAYLKGSFSESSDLYVTNDFNKELKISNTNTQQVDYNWGTNELVHWTTPKGHPATGVLFKPENFDPAKKYPMIVYFYEKLSDNLHRYEAPAPTPSRLNIPFYVSNEYLVFTPDISYEDGHPGKSAEEFINSGVEYLKKNSWVDGQKIGIQGQSWGGYQVAHLITVNDMYAAAWSGAPVVNMTSAYGGIRWKSGMSRQFQYERTQSRIGKTLWEGYDLYIENSPLFHMTKVSTPVAIMHNDMDGAVPWYQGIEMFMALRRLGKPAWLLNYNDDEHNLMKRQNRKDIQIRQQQFFDYYLKGKQAPVWMVKGVPATMKGKDWGFELTDEEVK